MHAVVKTEKGRPRVLQVGLRNILNPVEGAVLVPVEDPRDIRPLKDLLSSPSWGPSSPG